MTRVLLDANLLLLYVVGKTRQDLIGKHRRVKQFNSRDYPLLRKMLCSFSQIILTPNIVTECSDLLSDEPKDDFAKSNLKAFIENDDFIVFEQYVQSRSAVRMAEYNYLGVADCSLLSLVDSNTVLLTMDHRLAEAATKKNPYSLNFNHYRNFN